MSTLYDRLQPVAIFGALFGAGGGQVKVLSSVMAADADRRTSRGRLLDTRKDTTAKLFRWTGFGFKRTGYIELCLVNVVHGELAPRASTS
jgi:hypothetical protein